MWSPGSVIEVRLQRGAYLRARAVQQDALVGSRQVERAADLGCAETDDVAHRDHPSLRRGQVNDDPLHDLERLEPDEFVVGLRAPVARIDLPVAGEHLTRGPEALRLDARPGCVRRLERRHGDGARLAPDAFHWRFWE